MNLHTLETHTHTKKKRLGQGHGSGRGKTSGRGTKGQKARGKIPIQFEGGAVTLIKRLPFLRGKGRNKPFGKKPIVLDIAVLAAFSKNAVVDLDSLVKQGIISEKEKKHGVKIVGDGTIVGAVTVKVPVSKSAKAKIEKAGGFVTIT